MREIEDTLLSLLAAGHPEQADELAKENDLQIVRIRDAVTFLPRRQSLSVELSEEGVLEFSQEDETEETEELLIPIGDES